MDFAFKACVQVKQSNEVEKIEGERGWGDDLFL